MVLLVDRIQGWQLEALEVKVAWVRLWILDFLQVEEDHKEKEW